MLKKSYIYLIFGSQIFNYNATMHVSVQDAVFK